MSKDVDGSAASPGSASTDIGDTTKPVSSPFDQVLRKEFVSVDVELLRSIHERLFDARDLGNELLINHDAACGRTTRKNKMWAEELERVMANIKADIAAVRAALGWPPLP